MARLLKDAAEDIFGKRKDAEPKPPSDDDAPEPKRQSPPAGGSSSTTPKRPPWAPKLERELTELFAEYGTMIGLALPLTGYVFADRAERRAHAWVLLAETNPGVKKALDKMLKGSAYGMIAADIAAIAVAAGVEFGRIPPVGGAAHVFKVDEAAMAVGYRMHRKQEAEVADTAGDETIAGAGASAGGLMAELAGSSAA